MTMETTSPTGTIHQKELHPACHRERRETAPPGKNEMFQHLFTEHLLKMTPVLK